MKLYQFFLLSTVIYASNGMAVWLSTALSLLCLALAILAAATLGTRA